MEREFIRRRLPYAVGLQRIHASLVWEGAKTMWLRQAIELDARAAVQREANRALADKPAEVADMLEFID